MESKVDSWNDDRLDELSRRVDKGFEKAATREQVTATREQITALSGRLEKFEGRIQERMDRIYWAFIALVLALIANGILS